MNHKHWKRRSFARLRLPARLRLLVLCGLALSLALVGCPVAVPNLPPSIENQSIAANENISAGALIGRVRASDPEGNPLAFAITANSPSATSLNQSGTPLFAIHPRNGELRLAASHSLDYESARSHSITVQVSDGTHNASAQVTITVNNINDGEPTIAPQGFTASEDTAGGTLIDTVEALDPDGDPLAFAITANSPSASSPTPSGTPLFAIHPSSGELRLAANHSLDYESARSHSITVQVSDGQSTASAEITIAVGDTPEAPTLADQSFSASESVGAATSPRPTPIGTVEVGNFDSSDQHTFTVAGASASLFEIDATTRELRLSAGATLNFEEAQEHRLAVQVNDGEGNSDSATITVRVRNIPEAPRIRSGTRPAPLPEGTAEGALISTIELADVDANERHMYSLAGASAHLFEIVEVDSDTLEIRLASGAGLDFETADTHSLTLHIDDGATSPAVTAEIVIAVTNINDTAPVITPQSFNVDENAVGDSVMRSVVARDPDNDPITFTITANSQSPASENLFAITGAGVLSLAPRQSLDYETAQSHSITVQVSDGTFTSSAEVTINVANIVETLIPSITQTGTVSENSTITLNASGTTADGAINSYEWTLLSPATVPEAFSIETPATATTQVTLPIWNDFGTIDLEFQLTVTAGGLSETETTTVSFMVSNVDIDSDGLIEIRNLTMLHNMRYSTDGSEYKTSSSASGVTLGCPASTCNGYELIHDLDFDADGSGSTWTDNGDGTYTLDSNDDNDTYFDVDSGGWLPINDFAATFNGNGFSIHNLAINKPSTSSVGLFGVSGFASQINNVQLRQLLIVGEERVGGFYGSSLGSNGHITITESSTSGTVTGSAIVGGLIGTSRITTITESFSSATISASGNGSGGLIGRTNNETTIRESYTSGAISGGFSDVGGLIGTADGMSSKITIIESYVSGALSSRFDLGGLIGNSHSEISIHESYVSSNMSGQSIIGGLVGQAGSTVNITASYSQGNINGSDNSVGGLIGSATDAVSITASFSQGNMSASLYVGGLVGRAEADTTITGSYASGAVNHSSNANSWAGGLVGGIDADSNITITASYSQGDVSGNGGFAGGFVGSTEDEASITASYVHGDVSGYRHVPNIGDFIGQSGETPTITESYVFGTVTNLGGGGTNIVGTLPMGVTMPSQLNATNAGDSWDNAANNTAGAWDFTRRVDGGPSLRFADYDGTSGNAFHCEGQTAGADTSIEIPNCGDHLGGQFSE